MGNKSTLKERKALTIREWIVKLNEIPENKKDLPLYVEDSDGHSEYAPTGYRLARNTDRDFIMLLI